MSDDDLIRRGDARRVMPAYASSYSAEEAETAIAALPAVTPGVRADPAVTASDYLDAAVSKAPQSLKELGKWLSRVLDEDQWPTAERLLNAAVLDLTPQAAWQPIETAPKGEPKPYGSGPQIYACVIGDGWYVANIVNWRYHKNPTRGAWHGPNGVWTPDYWWDFGGGATTPEPPAAIAAMEEKL